jgi:hypothetical protein
MPKTPRLDPPHQIAPDALPAKSSIHHQTTNLDPILRLQELGENTMNPANQSARRAFGHENRIAGTGQQSLEARSQCLLGRGITKFTGETRQLGAILLAGKTHGLN